MDYITDRDLLKLLVKHDKPTHKELFDCIFDLNKQVGYIKKITKWVLVISIINSILMILVLLR